MLNQTEQGQAIPVHGEYSYKGNRQKTEEEDYKELKLEGLLREGVTEKGNT